MMYEQRDSNSNSSAGGGKPQEEGAATANKQKALRENIMRIALTSEARQRLANVRMVKPEVAQAIEEYIIQMVSSGRLKRTIDDDQLKEMLATIQGAGKREFKIRRI